jgi:hypothetical protein
LGPEFCQVVGEERGLVASAGDRDVAETGVEQVRVDAGIGVNEDAFGGKALGAVTGNGVAVVEMTMLVGVEFDLAVVVEACRQPTIGMDRLDGGEVAIGNAERFVGRGEPFEVISITCFSRFGLFHLRRRAGALGFEILNFRAP